ncbi:MAG TPA: M56 family metallopeptidase, partial [Candidatus Acidoferrum sp.]|nr:M56 family metallopeptidase [Candidatus Acidoferrum sp.]
PPLPLAPKSHWTMPQWPVLLVAAWVMGVLALTVRLVVQNILFRRRLRFATPLKSGQVVELFESCRHSLRVSSTVELIETALVESPALYGFFRLRLLLPPTLAGRFNSAEFRHIFLHELAHVRRRDLHVQWLTTGLQILHWFNPVIWFGFRRMAADRELACDELALGVVGEGHGPAYGQTIVKLLECCAEPSPLPGLVGILEDKKQIFRRVKMIAGFKRHPRWSIVGVTAAAVLALATLTGAQTQKTVAKDQPASTTSTNQPPISETDQKVAAIVQDWENLPGVFDDVDTYAGQVRDLVHIGKPAVSALCTALDHTDQGIPMRLLGFTLRSIGDPRAVPALIRAIPKTLLQAGSDCGVVARNRDLQAFMRSNDLEAASGSPANGVAIDGANPFTLGRPVREICGALAKITGTNVNQEEIYFLFLEGGEQQRATERKAFYAVASRWADWWSENYQRFGVDPAMAKVELHAPETPITPGRFLTGANIKATEGEGCMYVAPLESGHNCFLALSLNHQFSLPQNLSASNGPVSVENATVWAAKAGADLMGMKYHDAQSGKIFYTMRGIGLQAWEIPNGHWATIDSDLQHDTLPALDTPAGDLLMHYDVASARYEPKRKATFLFITRDGSEGILRITEQITRKATPRDLGIPYSLPDDSDPNQSSGFGWEDLGVMFDYKFFYVETAQMKAENEAREEAAHARTEASRTNKLAKLLEKYPKLEGTVFSPAGQVISNADILIYREGESASLVNRQFVRKEESTVFPTRDDGHFRIPLIPHAHIYVAHEDGFAQMDLDETNSPLEINLLAWGRIEGTVTLEGKPAPHQKLALVEAADFWPPSKPHLNFFSNAESDDQGRFVFEGVPPEEVKVYRTIGDALYEGQVVDVAPGVTTVCQHGFNGRVIKGHFATSDSSEIENWKNSVSMNFTTKYAVPDPLPNVDPTKWEAGFWQSDEGKEASRSIYNYAVSVEPN